MLKKFNWTNVTNMKRSHLKETATTEVTGAGTKVGRFARAGNDIEASSPIF